MLYNEELDISITERDVDQDRFMTREQYKEILNLFPAYSKKQCYYYMLGDTGRRPSEVANRKIEHIDAVNKRIQFRIHKPKHFYKSGEGEECKVCLGDGFTEKNEICRRCKGTGLSKVRAVEYKIKWIYISDDFMKYLLTYIELHKHTFEYGYLFPSRDTRFGHHITVGSFQTYLQQLRDKMVKKDSKKYGWMKETYKRTFENKMDNNFYKISLYSFRKMYGTYRRQMYEDFGYANADFHASKDMAHTKTSTSYGYMISLINRHDMANAIKPPLNTELLYKPMPSDKQQRKLDVFF